MLLIPPWIWNKETINIIMNGGVIVTSGWLNMIALKCSCSTALLSRKYEPFWKIHFFLSFCFVYIFSFSLFIWFCCCSICCCLLFWSLLYNTDILNNNIFQLVTRRDELLIFLLTLELPDQICHSPNVNHTILIMLGQRI